MWTYDAGGSMRTKGKTNELIYNEDLTPSWNKKGILAILAADIHLRDDQPECRTDDFIEAQTKKLRWLSKLQQRYACPVLIAGDLFNKWKPSPWLLAYALRELPDRIIAIPGQHDLPAHSLDQIDKSGIEVLAEAGKIELLEPSRSLYNKTEIFGIVGFPWGVELEDTKRTGKFKIALVHKLIYKAKELPFPGADSVGSSVRGIAKALSGYDVIVTGDNHQTICEKVGDSWVVNAGSFMRTTAAQIKHEPSVFLLYDDYTVGQLRIPCSKGVITRDHIDRVTDKESRMTALAERLNMRIELGLSFEDNLQRYISKHKIPKGVQSIIWEVVNAKV
jgi:DNA repair exonuclease SbcCD nuclease subunit